MKCPGMFVLSPAQLEPTMPERTIPVAFLG
jgi:hypothetical protein